MTNETYPIPYSVKTEIEMQLEKISGDAEEEIFILRRLLEKVYQTGYVDGKMAQQVESAKDHLRWVEKIKEATP
jgi:hypothetical protein